MSKINVALAIAGECWTRVSTRLYGKRQAFGLNAGAGKVCELHVFTHLYNIIIVNRVQCLFYIRLANKNSLQNNKHFNPVCVNNNKI